MATRRTLILPLYNVCTRALASVYMRTDDPQEHHALFNERGRLALWGHGYDIESDELDERLRGAVYVKEAVIGLLTAMASLLAQYLDQITFEEQELIYDIDELIRRVEIEEPEAADFGWEGSDRGGFELDEVLEHIENLNVCLYDLSYSLGIVLGFITAVPGMQVYGGEQHQSQSQTPAEEMAEGSFGDIEVAEEGFGENAEGEVEEDAEEGVEGDADEELHGDFHEGDVDEGFEEGFEEGAEEGAEEEVDESFEEDVEGGADGDEVEEDFKVDFEEDAEEEEGENKDAEEFDEEEEGDEGDAEEDEKSRSVIDASEDGNYNDYDDADGYESVGYIDADIDDDNISSSETEIDDDNSYDMISVSDIFTSPILSAATSELSAPASEPDSPPRSTTSTDYSTDHLWLSLIANQAIRHLGEEEHTSVKYLHAYLVHGVQQIFSSTTTSQHTNVRFLYSAHALAKEYLRTNQPEPAASLLMAILNLRIKVLGEAHKDSVEVMQDLADMYKRVGRALEAEIWERRVTILKDGEREELGEAERGGEVFEDARATMEGAEEEEEGGEEEEEEEEEGLSFQSVVNSLRLVYHVSKCGRRLETESRYLE
ncbi:hypothetical protein RUND412_008243 [Rhizina undulata]